MGHPWRAFDYFLHDCSSLIRLNFGQNNSTWSKIEVTLYAIAYYERIIYSLRVNRFCKTLQVSLNGISITGLRSHRTIDKRW